MCPATSGWRAIILRMDMVFLRRCDPGEQSGPSPLFLWIARLAPLPRRRKAVETAGSLRYCSHFVHGVTVMTAAVLGFILVALAIGAIIGWLIGSRAAAAARQVTE